jgi:serine/threonine-protein kinase
VVHRDLKPENIMLDETGQVKLMDFGLARCDEVSITQAGKIVGTPGYLSPEMIEGQPADQRADIYAAGCVLYEMFTGQRAFAGDLPVAVTLRQIHEQPRPPHELEPGIPASVDRAILRCLERRPERRFASVDELEAAIQDALPPPSLRSMSGRQVTVKPPAAAAPARWLRTAGLTAALSVLGVGVIWLSGRRAEEPVPPPRAAQPVAPPPAEARETKPPEVRPVNKPAPKARPRSAQLLFEYQLKDGQLTISSGGAVILTDALKGARKGGFMGIKSSFAGVLSKPITIPAGAQELSVQVISDDKSVTHTTRVAASPPDREATTLHLSATRTLLTAAWRKPPGATDKQNK